MDFNTIIDEEGIHPKWIKEMIQRDIEAKYKIALETKWIKIRQIISIFLSTILIIGVGIVGKILNDNIESQHVVIKGFISILQGLNDTIK